MKAHVVRALAALFVPLVILAGTMLAAPTLTLPASLAGLKQYGPWVALGAAALISLIFNRGRVFFALGAFAVAYLAFAYGWIGHMRTFPERAVFAGLWVFVPLYVALLGWLKERGVWNGHGANRFLVGLALFLFTGWLIIERKTAVVAWAYARLWDPAALSLTSLPHLGLVIAAGSLAAITAAGVLSRSPIDAGLGAALVAFGIACNRIGTPDHFAVFVSAAALILVAAVLEDTFRMAYRDELTGLPGRRALNERLLSLGSQYAIAMVDVDHFKRFNDTYGHEIGDQVLRMVAARMARTGGGGKPFRYGGEEFTLLFPGRRAAEALPHLEALRADIENYPMAIRGPDRPAKSPGTRRQLRRRRNATVSVTVSIGVAEAGEKLGSPEEVIRAADKALYRAKEGGRNRVMRG